MEFSSFEEAIHVCMTAPDGSPEQVAALAHCLKTAPPDLLAMLAQRMGVLDEHDDHDHDHGCGCGCSAEQE